MNFETYLKLALVIVAILVGIHYILAPEKIAEDLDNGEDLSNDTRFLPAENFIFYPNTQLPPYQFPVDWSDFHVHEDF